MTREEAIAILKQDIQSSKQNISYCHNNVGIEALNMAIKALDEEPHEDCISRKAVQDLINTWLNDYLAEETREALEVINGKIGDMPSVRPRRAKGHLVSNQQDGEVKPFWERYRCSICGEYAQDNFNYCSRCGAELEGEEE